MKKLILFVSLITLVGLACNNSKQTNEVKTDTTVVEGKKVIDLPAPTTYIKTHACNAMCNGSSHHYIHNEIGHTCSSQCGKPHVCGNECKNETHVYAHGEVGHYCLCTPQNPS